MKKSFFSIVLCLLAWQIAQAQISFAPSVGMNFSKTLITHSHFPQDVTPLQGYYVGFLTNRMLTERWSFQNAMQYSQKGEVWGARTIATKFKFHYLDFLPAIEYRIGKQKQLGVSSGLNVGYDLLEQSKSSTDKNWLNSKFNLMKKLDLGFLLGIKVYCEKFFLTMSYNQSILNTSNLIFTDEQGVEQPTKIYNQNLQIGIGYFLISTSKNRAK